MLSWRLVCLTASSPCATLANLTILAIVLSRFSTLLELHSHRAGFARATIQEKSEIGGYGLTYWFDVFHHDGSSSRVTAQWRNMDFNAWRELAEGTFQQCGSGQVKPKGLVDGVQAGCFPQLYQALAGSPPDQVITL